MITYSIEKHTKMVLKEYDAKSDNILAQDVRVKENSNLDGFLDQREKKSTIWQTIYLNLSKGKRLEIWEMQIVSCKAYE